MVATSVTVLPAPGGTGTGTVGVAVALGVAVQSPRVYCVVNVPLGSVGASHDTDITNTSTSAASDSYVICRRGCVNCNSGCHGE